MGLFTIQEAERKWEWASFELGSSVKQKFYTQADEFITQKITLEKGYLRNATLTAVIGTVELGVMMVDVAMRLALIVEGIFLGLRESVGVTLSTHYSIYICLKYFFVFIPKVSLSLALAPYQTIKNTLFILRAMKKESDLSFTFEEEGTLSFLQREADTLCLSIAKEKQEFIDILRN